MKQSFAQVVASADDAELCDTVFHRISEKYGSGVDAKKYVKEARVVILTHLTRGIIGNGGFRYLLEGDFPGDPGFRLTVEAFEIICVRPAVAAFKKILSIFPNSRPPKDIERRLEIFLSTRYSTRQKIDEKFWNSDEEITKKLAQYIRAHREAFDRLKLR